METGNHKNGTVLKSHMSKKTIKLKIMESKVLPFIAKVGNNGSPTELASQVEAFIVKNQSMVGNLLVVEILNLTTFNNIQLNNYCKILVDKMP
jgi:hypothetical protein